MAKKKQKVRSKSGSFTKLKITTAKENKTNLRLGHGRIIVPKTKVQVLGLGGGGGNIVAGIAPAIRSRYISFVAANTDLQALQRLASPVNTFHLGEQATRSLSTGMDPALGEQAAQESKERLDKLFRGIDLVILITSLGGGTGSGALPIFAARANQSGSKVLVIVTLPFRFEGSHKLDIARETIAKVESLVDGFIILENEKIFKLIDRTLPLKQALSAINQQLVVMLGDLIQVLAEPGLINIDFADLKTILNNPGKAAFLNSLTAEGEGRVEKVIELLFNHPLAALSFKHPNRALLNITGGQDLKISEVRVIAQALYDQNPRAKIILGVGQRRDFDKKIKATVLALGRPDSVEIKKPALKPASKASNVQVHQVKVVHKKEPAGPKTKKPDQPVSAKGNLAKKAARPKPTVKPKPMKVRKNALDLKKETKQLEKELLEQETKWDSPAFLRHKKLKALVSKLI